MRARRLQLYLVWLKKAYWKQCLSKNLKKLGNIAVYTIETETYLHTESTCRRKILGKSKKRATDQSVECLGRPMWWSKATRYRGGGVGDNRVWLPFIKVGSHCRSLASRPWPALPGILYLPHGGIFFGVRKQSITKQHSKDILIIFISASDTWKYFTPPPQFHCEEWLHFLILPVWRVRSGISLLL